MKEICIQEEDFIMDDKKRNGSPEKDRINVNEKHELLYWSDKFDITKVKLKAAVNAVGSLAQDVEVYLKKK